MVQTASSSHPSFAYSSSILNGKKENKSIDVVRRISELSLQPGRIYIPCRESLCRSLQDSPFGLISTSHASLHALSGGVLNLNPSPKFSFSSSSSSLFSAPAFGMAITSSKRTGQSRTESLGLRRNSLVTEDKATTGEATPLKEGGGKGGSNGGDGGGGGGGGGGDAINWISSALVLAFWAGLLFYGVTMSPNQTQYRDVYFVEKLLNLHSDDGFTMNKVLIAEFYIMGVWPVVYSSLLIPNGRSRKGGPKVGPFAVVSFFVGAFALLPYFGLWRPPPPAVFKDELRRFPLNILESKITAVATVVAGICLAAYAGLAGVDQWAEFLQYFRESRFIHIMSIDFLTLCALAPFWVFNDLSVRQGSESMSWLISLSAIPYFGPAIYLCIRPPLPGASIMESGNK